MSREPFKIAQRQGSLVELLTAELSDVRVRGIDAVNRDDRKQKRLFIPELDAIVANSPWAREPRQVALRRVIGRGIQYCETLEVRQALEAFYGIDAHSGSSADGRRKAGLKALSVPPLSSAEHKKQRIREVRAELARAILVAVANGFEPPNPGDDFEDLPEEPSSPTIGRLLEELRALTEGRGVTPSKLETQAPFLLKMPGVEDEFRRAAGVESLAECAVKFLTCATRVSSMRESHKGRLVFEILNLGQIARNYDYRVDKYMAETDVADKDQYLSLEAGAFGRFAYLISGLERSPCFAEASQAKANREFAEHLFGLFVRLSREDQYAAAHHLTRLIREQLPDLDRVIPGSSGSAGPANTGWLAKVLELYRGEYEVWVKQYQERIDGDENFFMPQLLTRLLLERLRADPGSGRLRIEENDEPDQRLRSLGSTDGFNRGYLASLALLAQMLSYNHGHDYWHEARQIGLTADAFTVPTFPIVPISDFLPDRSSPVRVF